MNLRCLLSSWTLCFALLSMMMVVVGACDSDTKNLSVELAEESPQLIGNTESYEAFFQSTDQELIDKWIVDMATYVLRKPEHANWETKFNTEFRPFFENKAKELEWIYALPVADTLYFYLIRDGRDQRGKSNRGVGGKLVLDESNNFQYFEEIFVTKIIDRVNLEAIGVRFMSWVEENRNTHEFIDTPSNSIEWPDGRLFYSVQKSEWRYVE